MKRLSHCAMLVSLHRRQWQAATTDREVSEQAERVNGAENGTMKVIKELVPKELIAPIRRIANLGYDEHVKMTVPGIYRGQSLLSMLMVERYCQVQRHIRDEFDNSVRDFLILYPQILDMAPRRFRDAYKPDDYPSPQELGKYFEYSFSFAPCPDIADWRMDGITTETAEDIRSSVEMELNTIYSAATEELYARTRKVLTNIASQARNYEGGPGASLLRDVTIENLKEFSSLIPLMNFTGDKKLDLVGNEMIDRFAKYEGQELRRNEKQRMQIAKAAERLLAKLG